MLFKVILAHVALVAAFTAPKLTGSPSGNPISSPGLNELVPVEEAYEITWSPTTEGPVTLYLLKGPSTNAVPQYAIAESVDNSGTYSWTPADDLVSTGNSGYGILLVDDKTGVYQYSTQFGISNEDDEETDDTTTTSSVASSTKSSATPTRSVKTTMATTTSCSTTETSTTSCSTSTETSTTSCSTSSAVHTTSSAPLVIPTITPTKPANSTMKATGAVTPSASKTPVPATGAASTMATSFVGLVFAAGVAVFAL